MKYIYIASPYTIGDVAINVRESLLAADIISENGFIPYAPLLCHLWHLMIPHPYDFWTTQSMAWLERCDAVVRLPGESAGADSEVKMAESLKIPVFYGVSNFLSSRMGQQP